MRSAAGKRLRVARSWQEELAQIPADGFAVRGAWLRNRVLTDGFRKSERLIYERSLRNDVDVARLWKPPARSRCRSTCSSSSAGQDKRAKFPTSKAHISAVFHSI